MEAEVFEIRGGTVTCTFEVNGMTGYREIDDSETSMIRPLGRRVARGTLTTTSSSYASMYSDSTSSVSRHGGRAELEPEPGSGLEPDYGTKPEQHDLTPGKQRDSLVDAVSRIEQEGREFQELALSYLMSGSLYNESCSTPVLQRGTGATPSLARLAQQHARDRQRIPPMSDHLDEVRFNVGDQVWVYSNSENDWVVGEIESIYRDSSKSSTDSRRTIVRVMYWAGDAKRGKDISANDRGLLRPMDSSRPRAPAE